METQLHTFVIAAQSLTAYASAQISLDYLPKWCVGENQWSCGVKVRRFKRGRCNNNDRRALQSDSIYLPVETFWDHCPVCVKSKLQQCPLKQEIKMILWFGFLFSWFPLPSLPSFVLFRISSLNLINCGSWLRLMKIFFQVIWFRVKEIPIGM